MSILIKDTKMPSGCPGCPFVMAYYCLLIGISDDNEVTNYINERHPKCPLIEIPTPHGDLVDLNDMVHPNDSMKRMTIDEQLRRTCEGWSIDRKQYVVIEAEGSEK